MANQIPGINSRVQPGIFSRVRTRQTANVTAGGLRTVAIIGEGETEEIVISPALGGGADGVNSDFSGTDSPDGRHFQLSYASLVANRTSVLLNGVPLSVVEGTISTTAFDSRYDCRVEASTGRLQMQSAHLYNASGSSGSVRYYTANANNVGNGSPTMTSASLVDTSAPAETWTLRVVSVVLDGSGDPTTGEATLSLTGSVSGQILDGYGSPITWKSDGTTQTNGILTFSVAEGSTPFNVGDKFTITVNSGVLNAGDELVAKYIPEENLNDPEVFLGANDLFEKHGDPSTSNSLSLGAQMAFENGATQVVALQAKPPVPRKTTDTLIAVDNPLTVAVEGISGSSDTADCIFPLSGTPDADLDVKLFTVDSDGNDTQLLLNKVDFYNASYTTLTGTHASFCAGGSLNSYTVFTAPEREQNGTDGYIYSDSSTTITFSSASIVLQADRNETGESDIGKQLAFFDPDGIAGTSVPTGSIYTITSIGDGYGNNNVCTATLVSGVDPTADSPFYEDVVWQVQDPNDTSAYLAVTTDVANNSSIFPDGDGLKAIYVDTADADFYDSNWSAAYEALELAEAQFIVPLPSATISNIFSAGKVHVETMSNIVNKKERMLLIGAISGLTPDNLIGTTNAAVEDIGILEGIQGDDAEEVLAGNVEDLADYSVEAAYGDTFRVVYMAPDQIVRNIAGTNTTLPGFYQAAALGGFLSGQTAIQEPPTYKTLTGYTILRDRVYRQIKLDSLADAGVLVVQPVAGGGRMLHGLTTTQSLAPEEEEISIVGIRDQLARVLRASLRPYIGKVNSPTIISEVTAAVEKILRSQVSKGLLTSVGAISVQRNPSEPRQIDIFAQASPAAPINWGFIDLEVSI